ncbi:MAG: isochorismatase family protein [Oleibacter sp.]|nr:isochorismatase family protein [Thalassolituus sp.]
MLNKYNTGLIVVDIQGKLARMVDDSEALIANCAKLIKGAQVLGMPIICCEQNPEKLGATVDELSALLAPANPIAKFTFNAGEEPKFIDEINAVQIRSNNINKDKITTWLICGIEAHICVYQTALHLQQLGYQIQLVTDCISSRTPANKQLGINKLMSKGVDITGVEMCLYELIKDCRSAEFKEILNIIK